jgi:hypothetical protein
MDMRTRLQEVARFTWLRVIAVADELDCSDELVRAHVHAGRFPDVAGEPGVIDIGSGKVPEYRINPESFRLFRQRQRVKGEAA